MRYLLLLAALVFSTVANAEYFCKASRTIEETFDAADYTGVELKALAGELEVSASDDDRIHFWGKLCADNSKHLDMMDLDILKQDGELKLIVIIPYHQEEFDPEYATMDIELSLPADMLLQLRDSSGDMRVSGVSVTSIEDSSGDIRVTDTRSDLFIRDSSGEINVRGMKGSVRVSDSSGDIDLRDITGNVDIPGDSSGDIDIRGVSGYVNVERDSSGDIEVDDVGQDVTVGSDGSGDISIDGVKGTVRINSDGSGSVSVSDVDGDFVLRNKGAGNIRTHGIKGKVDTPG